MIRPALPLILANLFAAALCPSAVFAAPPPAGSAVWSAAPRCAATAEAAVRGIVGNVTGAGVPDAATSVEMTAGYRVQDLVLDPVLRRAYVRVADCHDPHKPLTLVPLDASLAVAPTSAALMINAPRTAASPEGGSAASAVIRAVAPTLIARGDTVEIFVRSSNVQMTLHGRAAEPAPAGSAIDVVLDAEPGETEPPRHLRGIAAGAHRVEVQR